MSLLPFLTVFILLFVGPAHTKIGYRGAESLMQIQRVLELSSEIAKAQDVSVSDISTAESKYTTKRQSYALPNELLLLVKNHLLDLKKIQANKAADQRNYVTPTPDHQSESNQIDEGHYQAVQYQDEQLQHPQQYQQYGVPEQQAQQYAVPEHQAQQYVVQHQQPQQYAVPEHQAQQYAVQHHQPQQYAVPEQQPQQYAIIDQQQQQYAVQQEQEQQYAIPQEQAQQYAVSHQQQYSSPEEHQQLQVLKHPDAQYNEPTAHSYVSAYNGRPQESQVLTAQDHVYSQPQQYHTDPNHHYSIAAHQAIVAQVAQVPQQTQTQHKPQQQMYFVGGHPQSGSYTEALIPSTPQQFVSNQAADSMNLHKAPVQINIHPQSYGQVNGYRGQVSSQQDSYMPLQILINHLSEPMKYSQPGITPPGGADQPKMPVYHYSPVPSGTLKNEAVPEMRIKSTYTPPNPHSDKYKDYPSSPPAPSSLNSLVPATPQASPPSSSSWYSSSSSASLSPQSSPAVKSGNVNSAQPIDWEDDEFIKYDFGYRVSDEEHKVEFGKTESKKDGVTKGSYHVLLPDGRLQVVKYWSDHTGYHTNISYSVPGVDDKA